MTTKLYGIKNCDTVKKAQKWLEKHHIEYHFHDFRKDEFSKSQVKNWLKAIGWETLINKRSTTWKSLSDIEKDQLSGQNAFEIILASPTLIKRPLLEINDHYYVGFSEESYKQIFS